MLKGAQVRLLNDARPGGRRSEDGEAISDVPTTGGLPAECDISDLNDIRGEQNCPAELRQPTGS